METADTPLPLRKVFVLGAGFTRAFLPKAPLLTDHYYSSSLRRQFKEFPHALRLLALEENKNLFGQINIERLMTRLDGQMPYDSEQGVDSELGLLLSELKKCFKRRLDEAKDEPYHETELAAFAKHCVDNKITCITFNYDDVLDKALWEFKKAKTMTSGPYWHPDGGYGFFCRRSESCIRDLEQFKDPTEILLLKLHGSINWRIKRGSSQPYSIDAIVHHEPWSPSSTPGDPPDPQTVEFHLEYEPFIVPPILTKSALLEQPILRLVWSLAYRELEKADLVTFIGYSFPRTDIAASFLFGEALSQLPNSRIKVINLARDEEQEETMDCKG